MPQKISFINLKGGVGKTTLAVNVAADLAHYEKMRVLLVDLDPQTNSTLSLIPPQTVLKLIENKETLKRLYDTIIDSPYKKSTFAFEDIVARKAGGVDRLDLIPSDLRLIDVDIQISRLPITHSIIKNAFTDAFDDYEYVIFDCPPNLGILTQNGIFASDYYLVPVQPDFLSSFGLDLVRGRVEWFKGFLGEDCKLQYGGVVFSRVRNTREHQQRMLQLRSRKQYSPVFKTIIAERTAISEAAGQSLPICLSKSGFGWSDVNTMFRNLTKEFMEHFPVEV